MKVISILTALLFVFSFCRAQESPGEKGNSRIGIAFSSFGENGVFRFQKLDGAASYRADHFYSIGLDYICPVNQWLELESGIEYAKHSVVVRPNLPPAVGSEPYKSDISLVNIPLTSRLNFWNYLFVNGGFIVDIDLSKSKSVDSQTGIGGLIGIGAKYDFDFGVSIFVNPYIKTYALIPFSGERYQQRVVESGIRIGMTYALKKKN